MAEPRAFSMQAQIGGEGGGSEFADSLPEGGDQPTGQPDTGLPWKVVGYYVVGSAAVIG